MRRIISPLTLALVGLILFGDGAYIHAKAWLAQVLLERAFTEGIASGQPTKPWSWADTWPVARIEVKRIGASAIVLAGSSGQALAFGPGHVEQTADAGERGVAVYAAHRDTHFHFLRDVAIGDAIEVTRSDGKHFHYRADSSAIVRFDASGIDPHAQGYELVLSTCWPFDALTSGPDRYILHATLIGTGS
ncbi:class GN sortase [Bradyrhizobium sp. CCGUVB1N3]|uniref:class GN sortase n=1 Tax=Bradyrhizobium sp. CCGUVB1N3 TaxID=2949629 RepID=UPI0020B3F8DC|nr:class GN sortase [Bradyrhizobium sp. CCGUVB1N3]MCP3474910.1 class GN sortase [Bradyrhizobium sp. CCGUVB1N3]